MNRWLLAAIAAQGTEKRNWYVWNSNNPRSLSTAKYYWNYGEDGYQGPYEISLSGLTSLNITSKVTDIYPSGTNYTTCGAVRIWFNLKYDYTYYRKVEIELGAVNQPIIIGIMQGSTSYNTTPNTWMGDGYEGYFAELSTSTEDQTITFNVPQLELNNPVFCLIFNCNYNESNPTFVNSKNITTIKSIKLRTK